MMPVLISVTEQQVLTVLRDFLVLVLPSTIEVIDGQDNRVPEPAVPDFITMTPINRTRLATNTGTYTDSYPGNPGTENILQPTQLTIQLDVHGPSSPENAQIITTLMRDEYAVREFDTEGLGVEPLYADDARQVPFINSEKQYENRWIIDVVLQYNPVVIVPMQFFIKADLGIIDVDAKYPPT